LSYKREKGLMLLKRIHYAIIAALSVIAILVACSTLPSQNPSTDTPTAPPYRGENELVAAFAKEHHLSLSEWPAHMIDLREKNPETQDFVLNYPLRKGKSFEIDLREHIGSDRVPLLLQWDKRWGYTKYGNDMMGLTGCGPTCLSMVCIYLLDDPKYSPRYIADFAIENGYCVPGNGSTWTLISKGGVTLGLDVTELPLDKNRIIRNLEVGNPIICVMGPGDFTSTGHFIVLTGYVDGKISVNDPNSPARSNMLWDYEDIKDQIRNLWACRIQ
jgi:hypothetical protein